MELGTCLCLETEPGERNFAGVVAMKQVLQGTIYDISSGTEAVGQREFGVASLRTGSK